MLSVTAVLRLLYCSDSFLTADVATMQLFIFYIVNVCVYVCMYILLIFEPISTWSLTLPTVNILDLSDCDVISCAQTQPQVNPQKFSWIQVWSRARPIRSTDLLLVKLLLCWFGCVLWKIVVLNCEVPFHAHSLTDTWMFCNTIDWYSQPVILPSTLREAPVLKHSSPKVWCCHHLVHPEYRFRMMGSVNLFEFSSSDQNTFYSIQSGLGYE